MAEHWDLEADIVVVGFGAAGAAAAIEASRLGASVILLEKQDAQRHTPSTRMSGGMIMSATDAEGAATYLHACADGMVPRPVSHAWARGAVQLPAWLDGLGTELTLSVVGGCEHPELPGADAITVLQPGRSTLRLDAAAGAGPALFKGLADAVSRTATQILWNMPAHRLVRDTAGRVTGILAGPAGATRRIRADRGVILACGGYEYDEETKLNHLRAYPMYFYGNPGNTGDGVRMAQDVGAGLWHMNQMIGRAIGNFPLDDGSNLSFIISIGPPGYVITDRYGKRFANEHQQAQLLHGFYYNMLEYDPEKGIYPRNPSFWFFDETRRLAGPLTLTHIGACAVGLYDWSADNTREIERGWIFRGATIAEAAAAAGIQEPAAAERTVAAYNALCAARVTDPFGRPGDSMVPLVNPPFYCVRLYPGGSNTTGGPRRDERAQILDAFGAPIPGLYAAGELGQVSGMRYPADGSNISEALCFGRIAAESALADTAKPWNSTM